MKIVKITVDPKSEHTKGSMKIVKLTVYPKSEYTNGIKNLINKISRLPDNDYFEEKVSDYLDKHEEELTSNGWSFIEYINKTLNFGKTVSRQVGMHYLKSFESLGFIIEKMEEIPNDEEFYNFKRRKDEVKFTLCTHPLAFIDMLLNIPLNSDDVKGLFI